MKVFKASQADSIHLMIIVSCLCLLLIDIIFEYWSEDNMNGVVLFSIMLLPPALMLVEFLLSFKTNSYPIKIDNGFLIYPPFIEQIGTHSIPLSELGVATVQRAPKGWNIVIPIKDESNLKIRRSYSFFVGNVVSIPSELFKDNSEYICNEINAAIRNVADIDKLLT